MASTRALCARHTGLGLNVQRARLLLGLGLVAFACGRPGHPAPGRNEATPSEPATLAVAPPPTRTVVSTVEVDGLRVQMGTLPATGTQTPSVWGFSDLAVDLKRLQIGRAHV